MKKRIIAWIDSLVIKRFKKIMPKDVITALYRIVVERDLNITTKEISVKKGKIKYTLLVMKDRNMKTVFNLGRHFENTIQSKVLHE